MNRLSSFVLLLLFALPATLLAQPQTPVEPQAILVTVSPGDAVWEKYGHNMLWLRSPSRGIDLCYNWGLFDFNRPGFVVNFARGRMIYTMDAEPPGAALNPYYHQNRRTLFQRLRMTPEQVNYLIDLCEENRRPENKDYRYDYFRDNCSTRVRDMIDGALGGVLQPLKATYGARDESYRWHSVRLMQNDWLTTLGIDLTLGPATDQRLSAWDKAFLPSKLAKYVEPWVEETTELWQSTRPEESQTPPILWPWLAAIGAAVAAAIIALRRWPRLQRTAIVLWWLIAGLAGIYLTFMSYFTDHSAAFGNANLWQFSPVAIVGIGFGISRRVRALRIMAITLLALSVVGFLLRLSTLSSQQNWDFILLCLPIHAAVAWSLGAIRLTRTSATGELASTL